MQSKTEEEKAYRRAVQKAPYMAHIKELVELIKPPKVDEQPQKKRSSLILKRASMRYSSVGGAPTEDHALDRTSTFVHPQGSIESRPVSTFNVQPTSAGTGMRQVLSSENSEDSDDEVTY